MLRTKLEQTRLLNKCTYKLLQMSNLVPAGLYVSCSQIKKKQQYNNL